MTQTHDSDQRGDTDPQASRMLHARAVPGIVYASAIQPTVGAVMGDRDLTHSSRW